jgi:putative ABC transport system permease protein
MLQDLRYAVRSLSKTPGYTAVALLALALGIGANAAIFSFVDVMLIRPLPYPHAHRLYVPVSMNRARDIGRGSVSYADYEDWRRERELFEAVAVFQRTSSEIAGGVADPERADTLFVSEDFFRLIDVRPLAGRGLVPSDHAASAASVAVISYSLWQRRFGGDPAVIGQVLRVGRVPHEIVGVLPARASYPEDTQLFLALRPSRFDAADLTRRDNMIFEALARLSSGATREQADARLAAIAARIEQQDPSRRGWTNGILTLREYVIEPELKIALYVLLAAVGAVLLIACANLANLTLVRGAGRSREMGVRLAIGASRSRLLRQLTAESGVLGLAGGAAGLAIGWAGIAALRAFIPANTPFVEHVALDARVVAASALLTFITVLLVGLLPAFSASGVHVTAALKQGGRGSSDGPKGATLRAALVVAEVAGAVVLLVVAGLLVRSLTRLTAAPPGADIDRVLAARVGVPGARYSADQRIQFFRTLITRLESEPGVQAAAATSYLPVGGGGFGLGRVFLYEGQAEPPASDDVGAMWSVVTPDFFRTLGIPLVSGRTFDDRDGGDTTPVIIISETFARQMFPNQNPIGRRVRSWRDENVYREIVGVAADVSFSSLADRGSAVVYVPHAQQGWGGMTIAVRAAAGSPESLAPILRRAVASLDPELALSNVGTMELFARDSIARERLSALLMAALAALALALAVLGVYGVMSYSVAMRRQEMGVRLALGAAPRDLYRIVLARGIALTALGLTLGVIAAVAATNTLESLLYQTGRFDPAAFGAMALALTGTALVACILPARRAASADPLVALRSE